MDIGCKHKSFGYRSMSRNESLSFLHAAHFFDHFFILIFPTAAIALARDWNMTYAATLSLGTPVYALFALGTLPAGWLGDRYDRMSLIILFFVGCGFSSIAIAFSSGPLSLMVGLGVLGLFAALYHPIGLALVTNIASRSGRALAVNGIFGNMGLAGAAITTGLLAEIAGWRSAFVIPGLFSVALGLLLGWRHLQTRNRQQETFQVSRLSHHDTSRRSQWLIFTIVCVSALFGGFVFNAITISLSKFFDERLVGLEGDLTWVGAYAGLVFGLAAFAQLPVGELLDRFGARIIMLCLLSSQTVLLVALAFLEGWMVFPVSLALVTLIFAEIPITTWLLGRYIHPALRSRAVSIEYTLALGVGALIVPILASMHGAGLGFDVQFLGLSVSAAIVFVAAFFLPENQRVPQST